MCRFALHTYKEHWACFDCRKVFRKPPTAFHRTQGGPIAYSCSECGGPLHDLGHSFKAPRQDDRRKWRKVKLLFEGGVTFHSCGCDGGGVYARTPREAEEFLAARQERALTGGARLLREIERRPSRKPKR